MKDPKRLLAILAAVGTMLTGCQTTGSDQSQDPSTGTSSQVSDADAVQTAQDMTGCYSFDVIEGPGDIMLINEVFPVDNGFIFDCLSNDDKTMVYKANHDLSTFTQIDLEMPEEYTSADNAYYYFTPEADGTINSLFIAEDHGGVKLPEGDDTNFDYDSYYDNFESALYFSKFSADGKCLSTVNVGAEQNEYSNFDIYSFAGYKDGLLATRGSGELIRINADGSVESLYTPESDENAGYTSAILRNTPAGLIYCYYGDVTQSNGRIKSVYTYYLIDQETGKITEPFFDMDSIISGGETAQSSIGNEEYPLLITTDSALLGVKMDGSYTELINWTNSSLSSMRCCALGKDNFLGLDVSVSGSTNQILKLYPADPAELANVTNLDLFGYMDQHMINEFNHSQNKYRIVPCEFDAEFDSKESYNKQLLDQLNLSIASGKAPDLVCYIPLSVQLNLQNKGVFTDLYPLMDKDDKVNRDTVMPNLQKAMETSDGKLYCMPMGFDIATLLTKTSICDKENWTFQDMLDLYDNAPASADHLYDCYGKDEIMWRMRYVIEDFIDTEKATTNFDSPEFIKLLEFCNRFADTGVEGNKDSMMEYEAYITDKESWLKNDRIYLWEQSLSMPSDYNFTKSYFADNADMTFVGYPSSNGKGGRIVPSMTMAITETCQDKEGAWEFIKFCLDQTNTVDSDGLTYYGLPVLREAYENYLDSEMHSEHTASGNPIPSLSQEDRDFLSDYILSCDTMGSMADDDVINICAEEAGEYFAGERSAEETAQIIQSRVSILISERS
ncbi:MAG: extracellular solute-binding protein [Ruminococcus sp.]|nr:extracellular solute-binding protein [Ruminococcus sp.]